MNSKENWQLRIDPDVYKTLKKFPVSYSNKIIRSLESLPIDPYAGDLQKIKGEDQVWRKRIGEYRIFFELYTDQRVINVFQVERRTSKTY